MFKNYKHRIRQKIFIVVKKNGPIFLTIHSAVDSMEEVTSYFYTYRDFLDNYAYRIREGLFFYFYK